MRGVVKCKRHNNHALIHSIVYNDFWKRTFVLFLKLNENYRYINDENDRGPNVFCV